LISGASPDVITAFKTYGLKLGTAYQIYDDCLDLAGSEETAGKTLGSDLRKGKLTLPLLYLLETANQEQYHRFNEVLLRSDPDELAEMQNDVTTRGCLRRAVETTKQLVVDAKQELKEVSLNKYTLAMLEIGDFLSDTVDQFAAAA
jgi:octaprenyl-diphosphate synthase